MLKLGSGHQLCGAELNAASLGLVLIWERSADRNDLRAREECVKEPTNLFRHLFLRPPVYSNKLSLLFASLETCLKLHISLNEFLQDNSIRRGWNCFLAAFNSLLIFSSRRHIYWCQTSHLVDVCGWSVIINFITPQSLVIYIPPQKFRHALLTNILYLTPA